MNRWLTYWNWITAGILIAAAGWTAVTAIFFRFNPKLQVYTRELAHTHQISPSIPLTEKKVSLSDQQGKVVLINFWASWCPPCKAEMPAFQSLIADYDPDQVAIMSVNSLFQDDLSAVNQFINDYNLTFPILLDTDGEISQLYQVQALPTSYFIDQQGIVKKVIYGGPLSEALLRSEIDRILRGKP